MSETLSNVLDRLEGVRRHGSSYMALCPAHDDTNASLSVSNGEDGRVLLKCHAGCETKAICSAIDLNLSDLFPPKTSSRKEIVATYDYEDRDGALLYQTVRYKPKGFKQRRSDGAGGWIWSIKGVRRVLYRMPKLLASPADERIFICEGEKDCDNLADIGLLATTCPQGAGKWKHLSDDSVLDGHPITIIADKDDAGRKHANDVAERLHGRAAEVSILELPGDGKDASDWLVAGGTKEELIGLAEAASEYEPEQESTTSDDADSSESTPGSRSQASILVDLCEDIEHFHDDDTAYAGVVINGNVETLPIRNRTFKRWLGRQFYKAEGRAPNSNAMTDAITVVEGKALFDGPETSTHIRLAERECDIYLDLADIDRHVVRIHKGGWEIVQNPPARFRRSRALQALPVPQRGGSLRMLRNYINLDSDDAFILLIAWLIASFRPEHPLPILAFNSEQGSGKSTASRMLRSLVDPNEAPIRCEPREVRDLMIAATKGWIVALDNLSRIPIWLSDALCRLSTGGGLSTRVLYENDEECIFNVLRPVIINGIEELGTRSDLLDRTIRISLPTIPEAQRRPEDVLYEDFNRDRPFILGAILDAVATALGRIDDVQLDRYPRMADFAKWIVAAEPSLPWNEGAFMEAYCANRDAANDLALEGSPLSDAVREFAASEGQWTGRAAELLQSLDDLVGDDMRRRKGWPTQPNKLSGLLRRLAPNLRRVGVEIEFLERTKRGRLIAIRSVVQSTVTTVTDRHHRDSDAVNAVSGDDQRRDGDDQVTVNGSADSRLSPQERLSDGGDDRDDQLQHLSEDRLQDLIDEAEERAAIMEYDGGLSRDDAERRAGLHRLNGEVAACR